jgi:hypothetical protein
MDHMGGTSRTAIRALLVLCAGASLGMADCGELRSAIPADAPRAAASALYAERVQPVFESRCAVCHGCYDSPCQLDLTSYAGVDRGASKQAVYQSSRLLPAEPTRLFVDAHDAAEWRARGFVPVLGSESPSDALLLRMLALGRAHPPAADAKLPDTLPLDINRELSCPAPEEFDDFAAKHPGWGMPYGMAPLADDELESLASWARAGAPPPLPPAPLAPALRDEVERWERFLNADTLKQHVVSRYLYEHWFLAHLYFAQAPSGPFFRVLRSATPPGQPIAEIATRRPYDDPGAAFWYRLAPIEGALLHKTHITYRLDAARMKRLSELFLGADWEPTRFPSFEHEEASNPFAAFAEIPARARYQFLLDDARYFVMNFIRGPVCHGQVAVNVIEDRFFVMFLDPEHDASVQDPKFLKKATKLLALPAEHGSTMTLGQLWLEDDLLQARYLRLREKTYAKRDPRKLGPSLDWIWDGGGSDPDALLTVFRHFDSAAVLHGFVGAAPKTAWVMDFPIFERIYYDLVAGFDVFGNVTHQVATRLYMDHLRMQAEDTLLWFLPAAAREPLHASWYEGAGRDLSVRLVDRVRNTSRGTQISYRTQDVLPELIRQVLAHARGAAGAPDLLNRCPDIACDRPGATPAQRDAERALRRLTNLSAPFVQTLPELTLVRLAADGAVYSLTRDVFHTNVAFLFDEDSRLRPERDELTLVRGVAGSYPNFVFVVGPGDAAPFVDALLAVRDEAGLDAVVERWGVRRSSPRFWGVMDALHAEQLRDEPTEAARFDLNRYKNL